jgi:cytoskeletal protein CcmA (bactofilin family)
MILKRTLTVLAFAAALQAHAVDFIATNTYVVGSDTTVADEQWVFSGISQTDGTFKNDLFMISGNPINLNGTFEGNVWAAASMEAGLNGHCERNLRLSSKTVRINGRLDGNAMAVADTIIIGTNAVIKGDVRLLGSSIILEGRIDGDAKLTAARVATLGGTIKGRVDITAPDILFSKDTAIGGDLNYTAAKEIFPPEGAVTGQLNRIAPKAEPMFSAARLQSKFLWFIAAILAGIPFITLFPMSTAMASQLVRKAPWKCLFIGFLASGALPMFGLMSISSIVGVPLGILLLASWGVMFYVSRIVMGLVIGTLILRSVGTSIGRVVLAMAIGLAIIYAASIVPSIGVPVSIMVLWLGMGSLILALLEKRRLIIQVPQNLKQLEELRNEQNQSTED